MSNIINKSNHPIEVKRVELRIWKLRDEIESAIERRLAAKDPSDENPLDISDIKEFYLNILNADTAAADTNDSTEDAPTQETDDNMDSSGNPMDDDAKAMMEALGGGAEEETEGEDDPAAADEESAEAVAEEAEEDTQENTENTENAENTEDDEAAMMAAAMLADQGMGEAAPAEETATDKDEKPKKDFERLPPHDRKIVKAFVLLSDIQMDQLMIFSQKNFIIGQDIIIKFLVPKPFTQSAEIVAATNISRNSKIISHHKPNFRLQSLFKFKFPLERTNLRIFLQSIEPDIPEPPKNLKRPDSDDDDDFDDLGF